MQIAYSDTVLFSMREHLQSLASVGRDPGTRGTAVLHLRLNGANQEVYHKMPNPWVVLSEWIVLATSELAQPVKCLPCKHEDRSLFP